MVMLGSNMFYDSMLAYESLMKQVASKVVMLKECRDTSTKRKVKLEKVGANEHGNVNVNANSSSTISRRKQSIRNGIQVQQQRTDPNIDINTKHIRSEVKRNPIVHEAISNDLRPEFQREQKEAAIAWQNDRERQLREAFVTVTDFVSENQHLDFRKAVCSAFILFCCYILSVFVL